MDFEVIVVGAGFSGIASAIELKAKGITNFVILEKEGDLGGVWLKNRYPGATCDIRSHLYSLSRAPNPNWTMEFASAQEIWAYMSLSVEKLGLKNNVKTNFGVIAADFDPKQNLWAVKGSDGTVLRSNFLIVATGTLRIPKIPKLEGLNLFKGESFHSSNWSENVEWGGKTIAVVGTGASAIQIVPRIVLKAKKLILFQRTPTWVLPKFYEGVISEKTKGTFQRFPILMRFLRAFLLFRQEAYVPEIYWLKNWRGSKYENDMIEYMDEVIHKHRLRGLLVPSLRIGCKRVLIANDWYPALGRKNVEVVCSGVQRVTDGGLVDSGGKEHKADIIVWCTGFDLSSIYGEMTINGLGGLELSEAWKERPLTLGGIAIPGFPNLFLVGGPFSGTGHSSVILHSEIQSRAICKLISRARTKNAAIGCTLRSAERFMAKMESKSKKMIWNSGCESWYLDEKRRNLYLWPGFSWEMYLYFKLIGFYGWTITKPSEV